MDVDGDLFEIIVGTYEEYLLGYKLIKTDKDFKLNQTIANHSHKASLRSVACHNKYLASGSADECIHLYDISSRKECGLLMNNSGTVTCICFTPDGHYLICASEDGSISLFAVGSWVLDKIWTKAHKGKAVNYIAVHPSGKLALSVGNDSTLRTWNLIKGRCAYIVNIFSKSKRPEIVEWSVCGEYFGLVYESNIDIYEIATANIIQNMKMNCKISSIQFLNDNKLCIGLSKGNIDCCNFLSGEKLWTISVKEEARIKCLAAYENWLVASTSSGIINVYNILEEKPRLSASLETSCRITCMTISAPPSDDKTLVPKRKRKKMNTFEISKATNYEAIELKPNCSVDDKSIVHCYPPDQKWIIEL